MHRKIRNFCWTLNNPTDCDELPTGDFTIFGHEHGTNENTYHLQGYTELNRPFSFLQLKKLYPRLHIEERKGTQEQAIKYCSKDGFYETHGVPKHQGKRNDITKLTDLIIDGNTMKDVALECPSTFVKYHKGLEKFAYTLCEDRTTKPYVEWRWGLTGTGKTKGAVDKHESYYIKDGTQWWDGYCNEEAIIIDDFDKHWPFRDLLRLLDHYKYQGQTKGGYVKINSPYIYITCDRPPHEFWDDIELEQILRRLNSIIEIKRTLEQKL